MINICMKKYYTIYKITNKINNKIYIGKHITNDINDSYMGSGKLLKAAINKYGIENFTKEILFQFDNESNMNVKEAEIVNKEFVLLESNYNLCVGGHGGFSYINLNNLQNLNKNIEQKQKISKTLSNRIKNKEIDRTPQKRGTIEAHKQGKYRYDGFKGKTHTEENRKKIGNRTKNRKVHSSGKMWITNGTENKMMLKNELIPTNWYKGRVTK